MELNARLLSNTWFYSQDYQDELEFVAFGGRDELQDELQNEQRSDPFVGWHEDLGEQFGQLRDSFLNWQLDSGHTEQAEPSGAQLQPQLQPQLQQLQIFPEDLEELPLTQSCTPNSENSSNNSIDNSRENSIDSMMEENYSDCFFSQCKDPFESLLTPKDEDFIEIDVERSSPPSIYEEDVKPIEKADRYIERHSADRLKQLLRKPQKMIEKSRRGRPQNSRPISQKAQISKDWREKKKLQDQQLQDKVCKLEVENGQLCKQNTKMKDEIRELRKMVAKLQKRTG
ncbi:unnamed protein product, partial [Mesorhabditis belari]|uniref:BZIP domain-containing protein n=1 Tax=Mesorhabditis belari TaxID=2138241 RepID=A0AAF3F8F6_9BILA